MSVSPRARASAIFTTVATVVCCAPEPPRSAKFNSPWDNPSGCISFIRKKVHDAVVSPRDSNGVLEATQFDVFANPTAGGKGHAISRTECAHRLPP
jgi:hypothetical protein